MKKMTKTLWVFLLMLGCLLGTGHVLAATSTQPTGAGTQEDPYQISTTDELFWFAGLVNGTPNDGTTKNTAACAKLTTDITIPEGYIWTPIGSESAPYTGTFDGADYNIDNLVVNNSSAKCQGFVGYLGTGGSIKNLTLGTNCSVTGSSAVGGICGYNNGIITDCANSGAVSGSNDWVGGICGYNKGTITDCANSGTVSGSYYNYDVGGICGYNYSTITDCTNNGAVEGGKYYTGGICGRNYGTITDCANNGNVDGNNTVGGVCGVNTGSSTITDCANSGTVTGSSDVGGVCGDNISTITHCYWLEGTAKAGIGNNRGSGTAISKTAGEFASGEVCWLLNGESDEAPVWFQTLGAEGDAVPVLDQTHGKVYAVKDCPNSEPTSYNNNEGSSIGEHDDIDGDNLCDYCGGMMTPGKEPEKEGDIYRLGSYNDLIWFANLVNGTFFDGTQNSAANAVLTADITIPEGVEWVPMAASAKFSSSASTVEATTDKSYSGVFDGAGHKISNLNIRVNEKELTGGLFGAVTGTIKNLGIESAGFDNGGTYDGCFGAICGLLVKDGQTTTDARVENCFVINSSIKAKDKIAGAIVGANYGGTIANCYECENTIEGHKGIGHLVGDNRNDNSTLFGTVSYCYTDTDKVVDLQDGTVISCDVKTADDFASGEVCWLLNGSNDNTPIWYQNLDNGQTGDEYPVLDSTHGVVYVTTYTCAGDPGYGNTKPAGNVTIPDHQYDNGFCTVCGMYQPTEQNNDGVYQIANVGQLFWFAALVNGDNIHAEFETQNTAANAVLLNDITIPEGRNWTSIGNSSNNYTGTFDGASHTISGMKIESTAEYQGFVGYLGTGTIKNLTLGEGCSVTGGKNTGGICGWNNEGTISGCTNKGAVNGRGDLGGICGHNLGTVENCANTGKVTNSGAETVGGICGYSSTSLIGCTNSGVIDGSDQRHVGGICGYIDNGDKGVTVSVCTNTGAVTTGNNERVGGICGFGDVTITNCWNSGAITGGTNVGGICGENHSKAGTIMNCYSTGEVKGTDNVGGICGENNRTVDNSYWLKGTCKAGIGNSSGTATEKSEDDFKSGTVAYLLQGDQTTQAWGQTLGTDDYPVLTTDEAMRVYAAKLYNGSAENVSELYKNASGISSPEEPNALLVIEGAPSASAGANIVVKSDDAYTCANLVLTDGADFYTPVAFTATQAAYSRTLPETSKWGTIVLPFAAETIEGANLYEATEIIADGSEESILAVQPLTGGALDAHTPVLFQGETAGTTVTFSASGAEVAATADAVLTKTIGTSGYTLTGSLSTINPLATGDLFIAQNKFWSVGTQNTVGMQAFRAYIDAPDAGPAQVNALRILVGDATSIRQALSDGTLPVDVYNLQGVQLRKNVERNAALEGLPAGIYIVGGKKVVKK